MTDLSALGETVGAAWTRPIVFTTGQYRFAGEVVPYFSATLTITEALRDLVLAHQLPVDADDPVRLDELMQRRLDDTRAGDEIVAYLKRPNRIKFFNSLTVVLLPTTSDGRPTEQFGPPVEPPDWVKEDPNYEVTRAGGVVVRRLKGGEAGQIAWQADTVRAVIIDGQHRFVAMRKLQESDPHILDANQSRIPVLFVAPDPAFGFSAPDGMSTSPITTSRAIFTDINKNAKRVSSERQFLLDDVSLTAVAMRSVLTDGIGGTSASSANAVPARIPLAAIDWTRPNLSRFDDREWPYISTIMSVHQLVAQTMEKQPSEQDLDRWRTWINWVSDHLDPPSPWDRRKLVDRLNAAQDREESFALKPGEFRAAISAYPQTRGQIVALSLTQMEPYASMLKRLRDADLLGSRDELWLGQDDRGRQAFIARFGDDDLEARASEVASEVKTSYRLAYQVVFQRAFVLAAKEVYDAWAGLAEHWDLEEATATDVLIHWIGLFNDRVVPLLKSDDFWRGTAVTPDGSLNYAQIPMRGVAGLVLLLTLFDSADLPAEDNQTTDDPDRIADWAKYFSRQPETGEQLDALSDADESDDALDEDGEGEGEELWYDRALRLLDDDPYEFANDAYAATVAAAWSQMLNIRRGPASAVLPGLLRLGTRWYRDSLRRYSTALHQALAGTDPDPDTIEKMVIALGARRLSGATRSPE